ncbi:MAG: DUF904 domain-containing protein [Desulfobacula sp. GWF2_41_7]|nr:MAG: DUF904 domain-containing protein [Desulfobacula sp. GWF2_41_7]
MKLGNDRIKKKFDDIDGKIGLIMEYCQSLEAENRELLLKINNLEADLNGKSKAEDGFSEQEAFIQSKTEGLIAKLNNFSNSLNKAESSNR